MEGLSSRGKVKKDYCASRLYQPGFGGLGHDVFNDVVDNAHVPYALGNL